MPCQCRTAPPHRQAARETRSVSCQTQRPAPSCAQDLPGAAGQQHCAPSSGLVQAPQHVRYVETPSLQQGLMQSRRFAAFLSVNLLWSHLHRILSPTHGERKNRGAHACGHSAICSTLLAGDDTAACACWGQLGECQQELEVTGSGGLMRRQHRTPQMSQKKRYLLKRASPSSLQMLVVLKGLQPRCRRVCQECACCRHGHACPRANLPKLSCPAAQ